MAVSGKGPAPREVPFPLFNDTPDMEAYGKEVAETLSNYASFGVGLLAARPAAVAKNEGHIYWATDDTTFGPNGTWWISYSAAWHEMPLMTVTTVLLAALSVTTAKLGEESVTEPKLANESVGEGKIKNLAVTAAKIAANTITAAKLAAESVGTAALANLSVTAAKIANATITGEKLGLGTVRQKTGTAQSFLSWGRMTAAGAIEASSGDFTVVHTGTGLYEVKWTTAKASGNYAVLVTSAGFIGIVGAGEMTTTKFGVFIETDKAVAADDAWSFVALAAS